MNTDPLRPVAFVQPDHLNVLAHSGRHLVRMCAEPDGVCMMPLYTEQALWALRQQLLMEIRTAIPANMASDKPYRPVNLGWSQCAEVMRQYIDSRLQEGELMPEEQIMANIAEMSHGSR